MVLLNLQGATERSTVAENMSGAFVRVCVCGGGGGGGQHIYTADTNDLDFTPVRVKRKVLSGHDECEMSICTGHRGVTRIIF